MTINDLARTLPNGFHDAEITSLRLDFTKHEALFEMSLWIGDLSSKEYTIREKYRRAEIRVSGLQYCVIEPPEDSYVYNTKITIDTGSIATLKSPPSAPLPDTVPEAFANWIFVTEWNACIYISALNVEIIWKEP